MRVAYLRSEGSEEDIQSAMAALEKVGCDRVVVESTNGSWPESPPALLSFLDRMKPGDDLVVTRLDHLATSIPQLVELLASMVERGISVETIAGEFDVADPTASQIIKSLWTFEQRFRTESARGRRRSVSRLGRPRRLSDTDIDKARELIRNKGRRTADVASELGVSRATLYRSLSRL